MYIHTSRFQQFSKLMSILAQLHQEEIRRHCKSDNDWKNVCKNFGMIIWLVDWFIYFLECTHNFKAHFFNS
jgi:hypothetical protein